jgi:TIGR03009 family protein
MKPNLAMLEMVKKGKPEIFEKYICSGTFLYEFVPANKIIRAHELPQNQQGQLADDNFLSFLFGMKAEEAKRRYDLKLVKEDEWYIYIEVTPRFAADKADFQKARLTLNAKTFLPRQFWMEQPNGNEVTWDLPKSESGVKLNRLDFGAPSVPQGWSLVKVPRGQETGPVGGKPEPRDVPPRIVRPNER